MSMQLRNELVELRDRLEKLHGYALDAVNRAEYGDRTHRQYQMGKETAYAISTSYLTNIIEKWSKE